MMETHIESTAEQIRANRSLTEQASGTSFRRVAPQKPSSDVTMMTDQARYHAVIAKCPPGEGLLSSGVATDRRRVPHASYPASSLRVENNAGRFSSSPPQNDMEEARPSSSQHRQLH